MACRLSAGSSRMPYAKLRACCPVTASQYLYAASTGADVCAEPSTVRLTPLVAMSDPTSRSSPSLVAFGGPRSTS